MCLPLTNAGGSLLKSMREAAEEEKRIAIEKGSYHEGVPSITVTLDAGWSKRSHKHSYNAISVRSRNYWNPRRYNEILRYDWPIEGALYTCKFHVVTASYI